MPNNSRLLKNSEGITVKDASLFHRLYQSFLVYAAQQTGIASGVRTPDDLPFLGQEKVLKIRDQCHRSQDLLERFSQSNPFNFTTEEVEWVRLWTYHVKGTFLVVRVTKEGALFLDEGKDAKVYLVHPLLSTFEELLPFRPPVRLEAVLLPFKGRIVYDGLLRTYQVYFGGGMSRSIRAACDDAIVKYGLVKSLPYTPAESVGYTDEQKLLFYMKTKERREEHYEEIERILGENPGLLPVYHREMGRANSRRQLDLLREVGVESGWFAIASDVVVASGRTKDEVQKAVDAILPQDKRDAAYLFELK
jgi:hypothetical protein